MRHLRFDSLVEIKIFLGIENQVKKITSELRISLREVVEWSLVQVLRNPVLFPGRMMFSLRQVHFRLSLLAQQVDHGCFMGNLQKCS